MDRHSKYRTRFDAPPKRRLAPINANVEQARHHDVEREIAADEPRCSSVPQYERNCLRLRRDAVPYGAGDGRGRVEPLRGG